MFDVTDGVEVPTLISRRASAYDELAWSYDWNEILDEVIKVDTAAFDVGWSWASEIIFQVYATKNKDFVSRPINGREKHLL